MNSPHTLPPPKLAHPSVYWVHYIAQLMAHLSWFDFVEFWLESVQNWKFCKMSLFLARSRFEYCASRASPKKLARHWSLGPSLEMSPKFGKLASTSPCKWSIFKLIHYFFPFPCFIYLHLIQFYVRLNKITFLYVWIIENIRSKAL